MKCIEVDLSSVGAATVGISPGQGLNALLDAAQSRRKLRKEEVLLARDRKSVYNSTDEYLVPKNSTQTRISRHIAICANKTA